MATYIDAGIAFLKDLPNMEKKAIAFYSSIIVLFGGMLLTGTSKIIGKFTDNNATKNAYQEITYDNMINLFYSYLGVTFFVFIVLLLIRYFNSKNGKLNEDLSKEDEKLAKEKVFILFPTYPKDGSMGDGLLQAAGFLAAKKAYETTLDLEFYDHQNDVIKTRKIIHDIFDDVSVSELSRINIIVTMSSVYDIAKQEIEYLSKKLNITNKLSVIFTVASAPNVPTDGNCYFQYFISGKAEVKEFVKYCYTTKNILNLKKPLVCLAQAKSPYSIETIKSLSENLENNFEINRLYISSLPENTNKQADIAKSTFFIIVAFDKELFKILEFLSNIKYRGRILVSSTLSVKDWQEYLFKDEHFHMRTLNLNYINIEEFPSKKESYIHFESALFEFDLKSVISTNPPYIDGELKTLDKLNSIEQKIYKKLEPNYISAFCYDSVSLFHELSLSKYENLGKLIKEKGEKTFSNSPFKEIKMTANGESVLDLSIKPLVFNKVTRDILIVVDVQKDFCEGGTLEVPESNSEFIKNLNNTIKKAEDKNLLIIYTQDWHPENHYSFKKNGGQWPIHCVNNTDGAKLHKDLHIANNAIYVKTGFEIGLEGYSPYEDPILSRYIDTIEGKVYVVGLALEYCVKATCLDTYNNHNKSVIAIKPLIKSIETDRKKLKSEWQKLSNANIKIVDSIEF